MQESPGNNCEKPTKGTTKKANEEISAKIEAQPRDPEQSAHRQNPSEAILKEESRPMNSKTEKGNIEKEREFINLSSEIDDGK